MWLNQSKVNSLAEFKKKEELSLESSSFFLKEKRMHPAITAILKIAPWFFNPERWKIRKKEAD